MKLDRMVLRNFKGIKSFVLDTRGGNVNIKGDNATGKTTLDDAFNWLLFDKDSQGKADFAIKPLDATGGVAHNMEHEVEGTFDIDGKKLTLRKVYAEKWTKKRGAAKAEFSGHETSYFIDGVPVSKKDYTARIAAVIDEQKFRLLTSPTYFNEILHWQDRRRILLDLCGDIPDAEVIASDKALAKLPVILQGRTMDDHRKVIAAQQGKINGELKAIPVRIDEATRGLPDITGIVAEKLPEDIARLRGQVQDKRQQVTRIEGGGEIAEKQRQIRHIEGQLIDLQNKHRYALTEQSFAKKQELDELRRSIANQQATGQRKVQEGKDTVDSIGRMKVKREELRRQWYESDKQKFEFSQDTVCPTCGQALPEEQLQSAREKAEQQFKRDKAERLERITAEGKKIKADIEATTAAHTQLLTEIDDLAVSIDMDEKEAGRLQAEIDAITAAAGDVTTSPEYIKIANDKAKIENDMADLPNDNQVSIAKLRGEITALDTEVAAKQQQLLQIDQRQQGQKRIAELQAQEKTLAAEYERLAGEMYLTEQFIRAKVNLLEFRINSKFKMARFKLFDIQVNGGLVECCETLYNGVPYSSGLNNAARINVGLDIINTLADHYGFTAPIWIDNAEAVTELIGTRGQVIRLVVSAADKALRVELEGQGQNSLFGEVG